MNVVRIILSIILGLDCLALVVLVLMQQGKSAGLSGAIAGGAETFFGSGKASAADKVLARLTSVIGVVFIIAAIVLNLVH